MTKSVKSPRRPDENSKTVRALYDDPIFIPQDGETQESDSPPPAAPWTAFVLIGGSIVALLCLWWLAPEWLASTWKNLLTQIFHFAGQ